jgi:hypothetical protein
VRNFLKKKIFAFFWKFLFFFVTFFSKNPFLAKIVVFSYFPFFFNFLQKRLFLALFFNFFHFFQKVFFFGKFAFTAHKKLAITAHHLVALVGKFLCAVKGKSSLRPDAVRRSG